MHHKHTRSRNFAKFSCVILRVPSYPATPTVQLVVPEGAHTLTQTTNHGREVVDNPA